LLARFWAAALGYVLEPPPEGFATWDDWRRDIGLPDTELGIGADSIIDPRGEGPRVWFHVVQDAKVVKNRLHLDVHVSGGRAPGHLPQQGAVMRETHTSVHCWVPGSISLPPTGRGPLDGMTAAVKDLMSIAGHTPSFGHPRWRATHSPSTETAPVVTCLLAAG